MNKQTTDVYPTRYHAFDNPGAWAIFTPTNGTYRSCRLDAKPSPIMQLGACRKYPAEAAVLRLPAANEHWPELTDGAFIEIRGMLPEHGGGQFVVECHYTAPTRGREQRNALLRANSLAQAIDKAEAWLRDIGVQT